MKHFLSLIALLVGTNLFAQNPFEKEIIQTKYAIDSLVAAERQQMYKKEEAVKQLLQEKKITEAQSKQMLKEIRNEWKQNTQKHTYKQGLRLAALIQQQAPQITIDTLATTTPLDSLMQAGEVQATYQQKVQQIDSLGTIFKEKDFSITTNLTVGVGLQMATNSGDYFTPAFNGQLGLLSSSRLHKQKRLLLTYGLVWHINRFGIKGDNYLVPHDNNTLLQPYTPALKRSKLRTDYLVLPFELIKKYDSGLQFGAGAYLGVLLRADQKLKYTENDNRYELFLRNGLQVNKFTYGLSAQIGYERMALYVTYSLAPLFKNSPNGIHPLAIGIKVW